MNEIIFKPRTVRLILGDRQGLQTLWDSITTSEEMYPRSHTSSMQAIFPLSIATDIFSKISIYVGVRTVLAVYLQKAQQAKSDYSEIISDPEFLLKLAFLFDLFEHLNNFNKSLQERDENVITAKDNLDCFPKKWNCGHSL